MDDEMDRYLSRCLKNWSARWQPPGQGRERLLKAARPSLSSSGIALSQYARSEKEMAMSGQMDPLAAAFYTRSRLSSSFTLSLVWPFHMANLINLNS